MPAPEPLPPPAATIRLAAGASYRLAPAGREIPPAFGFSVATSAGYRYALVAERLGLGLIAAFAYQRYSTSFHSLGPSNTTYLRELSVGDFVAMQSALLHLGRAKPWLAAGGGVSLGHFTNPENAAHPDEERETLVIFEGQAGIDVEVKPQVDVGLHADLVLPFRRPVLHTDSGADVRVFGPRLALRLAFAYRF
jgi:hypothetical protein